mmetsp:Transcript_86089/g.230449  ORF Transcript_86089/g.230449 Transcript_86089/m.230449 type:complete len:219 (-) Transcript_86089:1008-1664(-)
MPFGYPSDACRRSLSFRSSAFDRPMSRLSNQVTYRFNSACSRTSASLWCDGRRPWTRNLKRRRPTSRRPSCRRSSSLSSFAASMLILFSRNFSWTDGRSCPDNSRSRNIRITGSRSRNPSISLSLFSTSTSMSLTRSLSSAAQNLCSGSMASTSPACLFTVSAISSKLESVGHCVLSGDSGRLSRDGGLSAAPLSFAIAASICRNNVLPTIRFCSSKA